MSSSVADAPGRIEAREPPPFGAAPRDRFYRWELDVVRGMAFVPVFVQHAMPLGWDVGPLSSLADDVRLGGGFAVRVFFALSAFLLTRLLLIEDEVTGRIDKAAFYLRRTLRIWPLYFFAVAVCLVLGDSLALPGVAPGHTAGALTFSLNWFQGLDPQGASLSGPLWSVGVEEQMYLLWPLLIGLLVIRRRLVAGLVILGVAGLVAQVMIAALDVPYPAMWVMGPTTLDAFAAGGLLAVAMERGWRPRLPGGTRAALVAVAFLAPLLLVHVLGADSERARTYFLWPLALGALLPRRLAGPLGVAAAAGLAAQVLVAGFDVPFSLLPVIGPAALAAFALGAALSVLLAGPEAPAPTRAGRAALLAIAMLTPLGFAEQFGADAFKSWTATSAFPLMDLACVLILLAALGNRGRVAARPSTAGRRALVWTGRRAYGLYVWHLLAVALAVTWVAPATANTPGSLGLALVLAFAFAGLSYRVVELPFLRLKRRVTRVVSS